MSRERNEALWAGWRDRVARYERRAESSAEFCRREGVSVASLFSWRRRLATETVATPTWDSPLPTFLPVRWPTQDTRADSCGERVEIELPNGAVVRLTGAAERLLRDAIAAVGALPAEASSC